MITIPADIKKIDEMSKHSSFMLKHELQHRKLLLHEYYEAEVAGERALDKNKKYFPVFEVMILANLRDLYFIEPSIRPLVENDRKLFCKRENLRDKIEKEIALCQKKKKIDEKVMAYHAVFHKYRDAGWALKDKIFNVQLANLKDKAVEYGL